MHYCESNHPRPLTGLRGGKCIIVKGSTVPHQDEAGIVPVPPAEGRHADLQILLVVENLTSAVGVATEDEAGLKPLQQLRTQGHMINSLIRTHTFFQEFFLII